MRSIEEEQGVSVEKAVQTDTTCPVQFTSDRTLRASVLSDRLH